MKITIPEKLREITLEQFMKYSKLINVKGLTENELQVGTVAVFCNLSVQEALALDISDLKEIYKTILNTLEEKPKFLQTFDNLGFIPNLDKMSAGEFFDLDKYFNDYENFHRAMAVMYRPIEDRKGEQYTITKYKGTESTCDERLKIPLDLFLGTKVFFWTLEIDLLQATKQFSLKDTAKRAELVADLKKNGVGFRQYIQSLDEASSILKKLVR